MKMSKHDVDLLILITTAQIRPLQDLTAGHKFVQGDPKERREAYFRAGEFQDWRYPRAGRIWLVSKKVAAMLRRAVCIPVMDPFSLTLYDWTLGSHRALEISIAHISKVRSRLFIHVAVKSALRYTVVKDISLIGFSSRRAGVLPLGCHECEIRESARQHQDVCLLRCIGASCIPASRTCLLIERKTHCRLSCNWGSEKRTRLVLNFHHFDALNILAYLHGSEREAHQPKLYSHLQQGRSIPWGFCCHTRHPQRGRDIPSLATGNSAVQHIIWFAWSWYNLGFWFLPCCRCITILSFKKLINLLLSEDMEEYTDPAIRSRSYPQVQPDDVTRMVGK